MATYILHNTHRPEDCEELGAEAMATPASATLKGTDLLCTCPSGHHGAVFAVEAGSEADALLTVAPKFRAGTRAYLGETYVFGESEHLPVASKDDALPATAWSPR